jgi:hypothetical protein
MTAIEMLMALYTESLSVAKQLYDAGLPASGDAHSSIAMKLQPIISQLEAEQPVVTQMCEPSWYVDRNRGYTLNFDINVNSIDNPKEYEALDGNEACGKPFMVSIVR